MKPKDQFLIRGFTVCRAVTKANVVAEGTDNATYHTVCNTSALAHDPYPNRPFRKTIGQLCDNNPSRVLLRHSQPTFLQAGARLPRQLPCAYQPP